MKKVTTFVVVLLTVLVSACTYEPFNGAVTDKSEGGYFATMYPCGNPTKCAGIPIWHDTYHLSVEGFGGETDKWTVKKSVFESCEVGDTVEREENGTVTCF